MKITVFVTEFENEDDKGNGFVTEFRSNLQLVTKFREEKIRALDTNCESKEVFLINL
jgi:hypothetical protein